MQWRYLGVAGLIVLGWVLGCGGGDKPQVVVYTALDSIYSEPILKQFEAQTGIAVQPVFDSEASKTTGLVSRLIAERNRPRCDVFWNNEIIRTLKLKEEGVLAAYRSPGAEATPAEFKDAEGYWTGLAARGRVLAFNTELMRREGVPTQMSELPDPKWRGKFAMAYPLFGTTATHAAVLETLWGEARAREFFAALKANEVKIMDGNATVCRAVAAGEIAMGLTDTDDVNLMRGEGKPIDWVLIDHDGEGALLVPNTVALVAGGPNPEAGKKLIDFILSAEVEAALAASASAQVPLKPGVAAPAVVKELAVAKYLKVDFTDAAARLPGSADYLKKLFAQP